MLFAVIFKQRKLFSPSTSSIVTNYLNIVNMSRKVHLELTSDQYRDPESVAAQITSLSNISDTVKHLTLQVDPEIIKHKKLSFKAGQWLDLFLPGVDQVGGFSMCSGPHTLQSNSSLELAVKYSTWPPAQWIHTKCKEGDWVTFRFGGDFYYDPTKDKLFDNDNHSLMLIAGGVGINPLYSIFQHATHLSETKSQFKPSRVTLLYSAATENELLFRDTIESLSESHPNLNIKTKYFVTRNQMEKTDLIERRISKADLENSLVDPENTLCYLCGPPAMVEQTRNWLQELNIKSDNVKYELWW